MGGRGLLARPLPYREADGDVVPTHLPDSQIIRRFTFEGLQDGRRVTGRVSAVTVFSAMRILRMTGLEGIHLHEVEQAGGIRTRKTTS